LLGNIEGEGSGIHEDRPVEDGNDDANAGSLHAGESSEPEDDDPLPLIGDFYAAGKKEGREKGPHHAETSEHGVDEIEKSADRFEDDKKDEKEEKINCFHDALLESWWFFLALLFPGDKHIVNPVHPY
jgi:hypothetical protein